jgi:hypothetical protein
VGGQIPNFPALARRYGNDPRIWAQKLPGKYFFFEVENQSAGDRDTPPDWTSLASLGSTACREPDVPIGALMDADIGDFWGAVERVGWTKAFGWLYLKHTWLTSGWAHIAARDGSVRRATQSFTRSFWDAGGVNPDHLQAILGHIPRHPFGPALYYSVNVEKTFDVPPPPNTDTPNYYYFREYLLRSIATPKGPAYPKVGLGQGMNIGYYVSDAVDPSKLPAANRPSAWLVYDLDRLPAAEKAALQAIAPVIDPNVDPVKAIQAGPFWVTGSGLNCMAFVDQNGSVIVLVGNRNSTDTTGTMEFTNVGDGSFTCTGLLGTPSAKLTVTGGKGSVVISVTARDTLVFEIPGLKWLGH